MLRGQEVRISRLISAVACFACVVKCGRSIESSDLPGVYEVVYAYGVERICVWPDGTYEQLFGKTRMGLERINRGTWSFSKLNGGQLELTDPVIVDDGFGRFSGLKRETDAIWPLRVRRGFSGEIFFPVNDDQGTSFRHIKQE